MIPTAPPRRRRGAAAVRCAGLVLVLAAAAGCGQRRVAIPADPGTPLPDLTGIHDRAFEACRGVRTFVAVLGLSGRAGEESLRGTVDAGFERPASMRLELRAGPLRTVYFVLVTDGGNATLWLPRDNRVLRDAPADAVVGALTGLRLGSADLQAILTGCVVPAPRPISGRLHANGWASMEVDDGAVVYLEPDGGGWTVRAAVVGGVRVEYPEWDAGGVFPRRVELHADGPVRVELRASLSQVSSNADLTPDVFTLDAIPPDTQPITIEELRESGPLRAR